MTRLHILLTTALVFVATGCGVDDDSSDYEAAVLQVRLEKDAMMFDPDRTVMRPKELARFTGLRYYPVDSTMRFVVLLERIANPPMVPIAKQTSGPVPYKHIGYVHIPFEDREHTLSVFQNFEMDDRAGWIPFTDETNGFETYGGGRYLDVELVGTDSAVVDFNLSYNPYCVYNAYDFNCAIPPASNRLPFAVRAGEKKALLLGN